EGQILSLEQPNLLKNLNEAARADVLKRAQSRRIPRGSVLFCQGEIHESIYLVEEGIIRTYYNSPSGREFTLFYWKPGAIVGTPELLGRTSKMWSGVAVLDSKVLVISRNDLQYLIREVPDFAVAMIEALEFKSKCLCSILQALGTRS